MSIPTSTSTTEAHQARISLHLSHTRSLVSSWLPPPPPDLATARKSEEEILREDEEFFTPMPLRLGLGAPIPKEFLNGESKVRTNDLLKRKIMGRGGGRGGGGGSKPMPEGRKMKGGGVVGSDEEEEEGRSALGRKKKNKRVKVPQKEGEGDVNSSVMTITSSATLTADTPPLAPPEETVDKKRSLTPPTRFGTFLDAYQAQKAKKKKKKKPTRTDQS